MGGLLTVAIKHDAWVSGVTMKKGRPGHVLHVLADPSRAEELRAVINQATGTMGIRAIAVERWPQARTMAEVTVEGSTVRMKITAGRAKPEFDDVAAAADRTGLALHEVASRAEEAWRSAPVAVAHEDDPA